MQTVKHVQWFEDADIEEVGRSILSWQKASMPVLVITHTPPDADAFCSALEAVIALSQLRIRVRFLCPDPILPKVRFLMSRCPPISLVSPSGLSDEEARSHAGLLVDLGSLERIHKSSLAKVELMRQVLLVDHHPPRKESLLACGRLLRFVLPLSSTSEVLWQLFANVSSAFSTFRWTPSPEMAMLAYVGILADLRKDGKSHSKPHIASLLKELRNIMKQGGIDPTGVRKAVFCLLPWERVLAAKVCTQSLMEKGMAVAHIEPSFIDEAIRQTGEDGSTWCYPSSECQEEIRTRLFRMHIPRIIALIDHQGLVSLRLVDPRESGLDMGWLARKLGGGGHRDRAAFRLDDALRRWEERHQRGESYREPPALHKGRCAADDRESWPMKRIVNALISELIVEGSNA